MNFKLTFRKKIILTVVVLASLPVALFGLNAMRIAGRFQSSSDQVKNRLLLSLGSQAEEYFIRLNESLAFIQNIQRRGGAQSGGILFNALQTNREMLSIGYVKDNKVETFFGGDIGESSMNERVSTLLRSQAESPGVHISEAFRKNGAMCFDMLYPVDAAGNESLFITFSLDDLQRRLEANKIENTGEFSLVSGAGNLFAGSAGLSRRLQFMEIGNALQNAGGGVLYDDIRGYQIKGKQLDTVFPLWLVFTQQRREATALTSRLKSGMVIFLILILVSASGASFILASEFSRPIASLLDAVKKNYSGEEVRARENKKDKGELALLISGFNKMIDGLKETREKLVETEKMAAVGEMANIIGHDIRNPLGAIKNGAYFLRYSIKSENERITKTLDIIDREIGTITDIIENLLGYSRQRQPVLSPVDVHSLSEEVISILEVPENIEIVREYSDNIPEYNFDRNEMKQVLINLINNAVQACGKDKKGRVSIRTSVEENGHLNICIADTGIGIPKDKLENIFKAFFSTKEGGTGLGMSSAKNIVERHEGTLTVKSEVNKGTEILISMPLLKLKKET